MNHQDEFTNPRTEQMWPDVCVLLLMLEFIAHGEYCLHSVCVRFCVRVSVCVAVHSSLYLKLTLGRGWIVT